MYRCHVCQQTSRPGQKLRRHVVFRHLPAVKQIKSGVFPNGNPKMSPVDTVRLEILREVPVCDSCANRLEDMTLDQLQAAVSGEAQEALDLASQMEESARTVVKPTARQVF